ncbi:hypothetical protein BCR35DRAFT_300911 [Leucosporidium creatinivorum]|uniref:DUF6534 domain-containing protein n=1 Tax=Leucosporidium creatinivorum TaxID=106004 RepID=A0A1Y2G2I7_9BASI|nr:hypothetical protein BCR35DRAFT_300911 [Leucosporidium creatinivorum]
MEDPALYPNTLTGYPVASQRISNALVGPPLMGWCAALLLTGATWSSAISYYRSNSFGRESKRAKWVIGAVVVFTTASGAISIAETWRWGTLQRRSADDLESTTPLDAIQPIPAVIVGLLVQFVFASRAVPMITNRTVKRLWIAVMGVTMLGGVVGAVLTIVMGFAYANNVAESYLPLNFSIALMVWMHSSTVSDLMITVTLCITLRKRIAGFNRNTDVLLSRLMQLSVESAAYTTCLSLSAAIYSIFTLKTSYFSESAPYAFWIPLPGAYAVSLFATLATRSRLLTSLHAAPTLNFPSGRLSQIDAPPQASKNPSAQHVDHLSAIRVGTGRPPSRTPSPNRPPFNPSKSYASDVQVTIDVESSVEEGMGESEEKKGWDERKRKWNEERLERERSRERERREQWDSALPERLKQGEELV